MFLFFNNRYSDKFGTACNVEIQDEIIQRTLKELGEMNYNETAPEIAYVSS